MKPKLQKTYTPKPGDPCFARTATYVIGNNSLAIAAACDAASELGYTPLVLSTRIQGEAKDVAGVLVAIGQEVCTADRPIPRPAARMSSSLASARSG